MTDKTKAAELALSRINACIIKPPHDGYTYCDIDSDIATIRAALQSPPSSGDNNSDASAADRCVPLERVRYAIDFYRRHEHWMSIGEDGPRTMITALGGHAKDGSGWEEAEAVLDDLWAVEQLISSLSNTKAECLATIDRMNEDRRALQSRGNVPEGVVEIIAGLLWKIDYPNGGSMFKTYESTHFHDKELYRKEAAELISAYRKAGQMSKDALNLSPKEGV